MVKIVLFGDINDDVKYFFLSLSKIKLLPNATESLNQEVILG